MRIARWAAVGMLSIVLMVLMNAVLNGHAFAQTATQAQISAAQMQAQTAASAASAAAASGASNAATLQTTSTQLASFASDLASGAATPSQAGNYVSDSTALSTLQGAMGTQTATPASTPASTPAASASGSGGDLASAVQTMVSTLTGQCWSCDFYSKVVNGMDTLFQKSYAYFEGLSSFMGFVALCIAIVICWKVAWFFSPLMRDESQIVQKWEEIMGIFLRTIIVFTVFLSTAGLQLAKTASTSGAFNPIRDLFFDGPLAVGTSIGCDLAQAANKAAAVNGMPTITCTDASLSSGSWLSIHVADATSMLKAFHTLGVNGIGLGMRTAIAGSGNTSDDITGKIVLIMAGLPVIMMFVGWTISFGLRYVDVALRAMVSLALFPVFAALWIFDSTRPISQMAMKSVFFMMALFAVSGLSYVMALAILTQGLLVVGSGSIPQTLAVMSTGGAGGFFPGLNAIAITVGSWGVAIGVASMSFKLAEELVSYEGGYQGEMGVGSQAGGSMTGAVGQAASIPGRFF